MFFIRSLAFVAMFAAGVFYSIFETPIPLWIAVGILSGMMLLDVSFAVYTYYHNKNDKTLTDSCMPILQRVAFYSILLLIMLAASLVATYKTYQEDQDSKMNITVDIMVGKGA